MDDTDDALLTVRQRTVPARTVFELPGAQFVPVIECDVEMPPKGIRTSDGIFTMTLSRMEIGDSFSAPKVCRASIRSAIRRQRKLYERSFTIRFISHKDLRVWRTA